MIKRFFYLAILSLIIIYSCEKNGENEDFDTEAPELFVDYPAPCEVLQFGDTLRLKASFRDNVKLKSYKLNVHHNFDHHTHGNHQEICQLDDIKKASNPFLKNWYACLPEKSEVDLDTNFIIPANYEGGDYHVLLYVTDVNGNQNWTGISIKINE